MHRNTYGPRKEFACGHKYETKNMIHFKGSYNKKTRKPIIRCLTCHRMRKAC